MRSEKEIIKLLYSWEHIKAKSFKNCNDAQYERACCVTRILKLILEIPISKKKTKIKTIKGMLKL